MGLRIDDAIEQLKMLRELHGNLELIDGNDNDIEDIEIQNYALMRYTDSERMYRTTSSIDSNYLDEMLKGDYKDRLVFRGICVKIE